LANNANGSYDRDRIHVPPDGIKNWSENLLVWGHDPKSQLCLWTHMGRMPYDPEIWEGVTYIYLPDGDLLVNRSMGVSRTRAAVAHEYLYTPVRPGQTWHYHFNGLVQRAKPAELAQRLVVNEPYERLSYELIFEGVHPVFDFADGSMAEQSWATLHLEQGGTLRGIVIIGGKEYEIDCTGYRDHSAGPRNYNVLLSETWAHCVFPSGRCFSGIEIIEEGHKNQLRAGYIYEDGKISPLKTTVLPELFDTKGNPRNFRVEAVSDGRQIGMTGEMSDRYLTLTLTLPSGIATGFDSASPHLTGVVEAPATYNWDGEIGYGWIERIRRVSSLNVK
jgi:hypothetical protein